MKLFIDSADTKAITECFETGLIDGVTTNPTLIKKSGRKPHDVYRELITHGVPDISMEVTGDLLQMMDQSDRLLGQFKHEYVTIKVPCTKDGLFVCKQLAKRDIRVNVTLIFSTAQAILAAKAGAYYVSPFIGRYDDNSLAGAELVRSIASTYRVQGVETQVLAASIRDVYKVGRAFYNGASVVTLPPSVFWKMYDHVLTREGLTQFDKDWAQVMEQQHVDE